MVAPKSSSGMVLATSCLRRKYFGAFAREKKNRWKSKDCIFMPLAMRQHLEREIDCQETKLGSASHESESKQQTTL